MFDEHRRRRARRRIAPGTGRPLKPFRWWQNLNRALFYLPIPAGADGTPGKLYAIDVPYSERWSTDDGKGKAHLYLDGYHQAASTFPAAFPVEGGVIEVVPSTFGLKRCHFVPDRGPERQLLPDRRSAEGRRARLARDLPLLSRTIGLISWLVVVACALLALPQLAEVIAQIPPVAERVGTFSSPIHLGVGENIALAVVAAVASTERATRLRYSWLDTLAQE